MLMKVARALMGFAIVIAGGILASGAIVAAPGQDRPGQITQAKVFVENRGRADAIPVVVQDVASVQVTGTPTVAISPATTASVRVVRQPWEYRTASFKAGDDLAMVLEGAGRDGWEATGVQYTSPAGITILLKRPK